MKGAQSVKNISCIQVDRVLDIVGTKQNKVWRAVIEFKVRKLFFCILPL